ncbi:MAG: cupredoxin domain-containing protein [Deltaproteobacteria bacterium]|nr:cupredoxin domain-containing protein [Deltaproteobacteria bacterium]
MVLTRLAKFAAALSLGALGLHCLSARAEKPKAAPPVARAERVVVMQVTQKGYEPSPLTLKKGEPVHLRITRTTDRTCANEFVLGEHGLNVPLPLDKEVSIRFTPSKSGTLVYGCGMDKMISGKFLVE